MVQEVHDGVDEATFFTTMALGSRRREGKSPELPVLPEEGELMPQQQQQPRAPKARQTVLPFVEPPIPRPSKYKEFGLPEPKK
ncbi:hypothetical protein R1flu_022020 [Riccia fluitans]|uniref:Uncharacterized protein n=1 Tax=Riccia fluitans TaxID=41844 RepID=A0ABD1ZRN7_9MARC